MARSLPAVTLLLAGLLAAGCARLPAPSSTPTATRTPEPSLTPSSAPTGTPEPPAPTVATGALTPTSTPMPTATQPPVPWNVALVGHIGGKGSGLGGLEEDDPDVAPGEAWVVAVADGYAYVGQGSDCASKGPWGGLAVVDLADLAHPRVVGYYGLPRPAAAVAVVGQTLYATDGLCEFAPGAAPVRCTSWMYRTPHRRSGQASTSLPASLHGRRGVAVGSPATWPRQAIMPT